jgi:hypothetical protein
MDAGSLAALRASQRAEEMQQTKKNREHDPIPKEPDMP